MSESVTLPIIIKSSNLRPFAYRVLSKKYGLNIQAGALEKLADFVGHRYGKDWRGPKTNIFLEQVAKLWKEQGRGLFVDGEGITTIIKEIAAIEDRKLRAKRIANDNSLLTSEINSSQIQSSQVDDTVDYSTMDTQDEIMVTDRTIDWKDFFKVIDLSHYKDFKYNTRRKQFDIVSRTNKSSSILLPSIEDMLYQHLAKLHLLRDRLLRNGIYEKTAFTDNGFTNVDKTSEPKAITPIKNLLGRKQQRFALFGLLTKNSRGLWQLQDDSDKIELVFNQCIFPDDTYFIPGNYVVADGFLSSAGKFHVLTLAHPPAEERALSVDALGNLDFNWDYSSNGKVESRMKLMMDHQSRLHSKNKIIFLGGELFLDDMKILELLKKLFKKLEEELTNNFEKDDDYNENFERENLISIVFIGSFISKPMDVTEGSSTGHITSSGSYKASFDSLANIFESYPLLCDKCKLIFVPGDKDPWLSMITKDSNSIWPKTKIPNIFGNRLKRLVKDIVWASNPCRVNYLSQDIVVVRDDLGARFRRNDISHLCELSKEEVEEALRNSTNSQQENDEQLDLLIDKLTTKDSSKDIEARKLVKTLLDQGDLSPFTTQIRPILSNYWPILSLIPLPEFILLSDTTTPKFSTNYQGCQVINISTFYSKGKVNYVEYNPYSKESVFRELY